MGHSTDVPLAQRLNVWIELVPQFLAHLQIKHVALASHSAGTIYLLNTLVRCRQILDPNRALVALVGMVPVPTHEHHKRVREPELTLRQHRGSIRPILMSRV